MNMLHRLSRILGGPIGLTGSALVFLLEGAGFPIPVEMPLLVVGRYIRLRPHTYGRVVALMAVSTIVGNVAGYTISRIGGRPLLLRLARRLRLRTELLDHASRWYQRYGLWATVLTRWFNWGFAQSVWACGIAQVPFPRFLAVIVVNDVLWAVVWAAIARTLARWLPAG